MDERIVLGPALLKGLFQAERELGWRPWSMVGFPSFFSQSPQNQNTSDFNALMTPINIEDYRKWQIDFLRTGNGEELSEVLLIAAYSFQKEILTSILQRLQHGPVIDPVALTAAMTYFVLLDVEVDPKLLAAQFWGMAGFKSLQTSCRSILYTYWNKFPDSIADVDLFVVLSEEKDQRTIRDHVSLFGRLVRCGYDLGKIVVYMRDCPESTNRSSYELAHLLCETKSRSIMKAILSDSQSCKYAFFSALLREGGYEFLENMLESYLFNGASKDELCYLLPMLAAIRPGDGQWLEPFTSYSSHHARMGAAYALAYYHDGRESLRHLAQDANEDVIAAAEFGLAVHDHGRAGESNACWALAVEKALMPRYGASFYLAEAICFNLGLSEPIALRHWRLLRSSASIEELRKFYSQHSGLLIETILRNGDEKTGQLDHIVDDDYDILGRSILLLTICDPSAARVLLDQLMQDCAYKATAQWLWFLLEVSGGPITPLAKLKCRIVSNLKNPEGLALSDEDLKFFPVIMADDFCLEPIVAVNAKKICAAFPFAIGKWIRGNIAPEVRWLLASVRYSPSDDPFMEGIAVLHGSSGKMTMPERYSLIDFGDGNFQKKNLFIDISGSDRTDAEKIQALLSLAQGFSLSEECTLELLREIIALTPDREDQVGFLLRYIREEASPQVRAAIKLLVEMKYAETLPSLIIRWQKEKRGDVLGSLEEAIKKTMFAEGLALNLLTCGSATYIGSRYTIDPDEMLEYFPNKEANLDLLMQGLRKRDGVTIIPQGKHIVVHRYGEYETPATSQFLSTEEFEKVVLRLTVTTRKATLGIFICEVGDRESDEVLRLIFGEGTGAAFWAYIE